MTAPLLSPVALSQMRAIQEANMVSSCDLVGFVDTRGPSATTLRTPVVFDTVPCRLVNVAASTPLVADQPTPEGEYLIYVPFGTDLTGVERLVVRGPLAASPEWTRTLVVEGREEPRSFSASVRIRASLATDTVTPLPLASTIVVEEA